MAHHADVLIVGSGFAGAIVARSVRDALPLASIIMVEVGTSAGAPQGKHLLHADDPAVRQEYSRRTTPALQGDYVASSMQVTPLVERQGQLTPGMCPASAFGGDTATFSGAASALNVGGMGVHWTAACPMPFGAEIAPWLAGGVWDRAVVRAGQLLGVTAHAFPVDPTNIAILSRLTTIFPSADLTRAVQPMPMAGVHDRSGNFHRTGPAVVFPPINNGADQSFTLLTATLCTRVMTKGGRVTGAQLLDLRTRHSRTISADILVVAADALRTPQLLLASQIRMPALGRYLNEHSTLSAATLLTAKKLGLSEDQLSRPRTGEPFFGAFWLPSRNDDQPVHGQMMGRFLPEGRLRLGLTWYLRTDINENNCVTFSDEKVDRFGLPAMSINFNYSIADLVRIEASRASQKMAGEALGEFDPSSAVVTEPGSSLHYTGTVRMGQTDDGSSVCDPVGRVWGHDNLFVAGNGVVPTALTCNCTLTAAAMATLTGERIARLLGT